VFSDILRRFFALDHPAAATVERHTLTMTASSAAAPSEMSHCRAGGLFAEFARRQVA